MLVVIAEAAQDVDRPGCPAREAYPSMATLARRTGAAPTSVRSALQRLAERELEVRVSLTTDSTGRPVYAFRGRATRYRLPHLRPAGDGNDATAPSTGTDDDLSSPSTRGRRRQVVVEPTTGRRDGDEVSSPYRKKPEGTSPQPPEMPSPSVEGLADDRVRGHRSWAAAVDAARDSGVDEADVEAVAARAITDPETVSAPSRLRAAPAYVAHLATTVRTERLTAAADRVHTLTRPGNPECPHGEPGGATLLPSTGRPRCPVCRREGPASRQVRAPARSRSPRPCPGPRGKNARPGRGRTVSATTSGPGWPWPRPLLPLLDRAGAGRC